MTTKNSKYKKIKLTAETVCVMKKALVAYKTKELELERQYVLELLSKEDYFLILYSYEKKTRKRKKNPLVAPVNLDVDMQAQAQQPLFKTTTPNLTIGGKQ